MLSPVLTKTFRCHGNVPNYRVVVMSGTIPGAVRTTHANYPVGVTADRGGDDGDFCDVIMLGIALVELGDTVTAGQPVQSQNDNSGRAVTNGDLNLRIGKALASGVAGDIVPIILVQN